MRLFDFFKCRYQQQQHLVILQLLAPRAKFRIVSGGLAQVDECKWIPSVFRNQSSLPLLKFARYGALSTIQSAEGHIGKVCEDWVSSDVSKPVLRIPVVGFSAMQ